MIQKTKSSQRQLLINRAKCHQITSRLRNNLEEIEQKTEKLSRSRCSSVSSRSQQSSRLNYSMEVKKKSPKLNLLQNIIDKIKDSKLRQNQCSYIYAKDSIIASGLHHVQEKQIQKQIKIEQNKGDVVQHTPKRRKCKLSSMLKDIKKCNQESTKAVNTIKKNIIKNTQQTIITTFKLPNQKKYTNIKQEIDEALTEVVSLREELRKAKQENKLLNHIIQVNKITEQRSWNNAKKCQQCGCSCLNKFIKIEPFYQNMHTI